MIEKQAVVIGSGPAGLAASIEAAKRGVEVLVVDENSLPGGQLFKQIHKFFGSADHRAGIRGFNIGQDLLEEARKNGVEIWLDSAVIGIFPGRELAVEKGEGNGTKTMQRIKAQRIVIATGASENAVSFPGWTLPGVMSAGAVQTFINVQRVLPGERFLMVGSGNVGLIVTYQLMQAGADVAAIVEAAGSIGGYAVHAAKVRRAGVPIRLNTTIKKAGGQEELEWAEICQVDSSWQPIPGTEETLEVDTIAIAAGLKPLIQLARMQGCHVEFIPELGGWVPLHDKNMETTCPGIFVVGDSAGVEEANTALEEGRLAGVAIAEAVGTISPSRAILEKEEIWKRLENLRLGPFGEHRLLAKKKIIEEGNRQWKRE